VDLRFYLLVGFYAACIATAVPFIINNFIGFDFMQMRKKAASNGTQKEEALEKLKRAFESAEMSSPGFSEVFLRETLSKLVPTLSDARLKATVSRMAR